VRRRGTGDPPVSSGHWPDETASSTATQGLFYFIHGFHLPSRFCFHVCCVFRG